MRRLRIDIAYDGSGFPGWQSQAIGGAIQDLLESAIGATVGLPTRIHGAGRTDAGVHAVGQVAHFDLARNHIPPAKWPEALNNRLPPQIRVLRCQEVGPGFHARFSAKGKVYRYDLRCGRILPPFEHHRVWLVPRTIDIEVLKAAAEAVVGRRDFRAFAANRRKPDTDKVREIFEARVVARGDRISITFRGDGFLYRMVRLLVGGMVQTASGRMPFEKFIAFLNPSGDAIERCTFCAPPDGLTLLKILY